MKLLVLFIQNLVPNECGRTLLTTIFIKLWTFSLEYFDICVLIIRYLGIISECLCCCGFRIFVLVISIQLKGSADDYNDFQHLVLLKTMYRVPFLWIIKFWDFMKWGRRPKWSCRKYEYLNFQAQKKLAKFLWPIIRIVAQI